MVKKKKERAKKSRGKVHWFWRALWFIVRIPYFIVKGIIWLVKKARREHHEEEVEEVREARDANYAEFSILETESGNFSDWEKSLLTKNKIGIILGSRGSGKTAFGVKLMENIYARTKKRCFAMGFKNEDLPSWITAVENINEIQNDAIVLVDEGGIFFSSRESMSIANKLLSDLIFISRHKNLTILFISQNSSNLDVNIIRQADFLVLKPSSLLQKDFERKIIRNLYVKLESLFRKYKAKKGLTYLYSDDFRGFVTNALPSFWSVSLSKSFR
ncbi:MAG: hypothetical protein KKD18_02700 [Nanoarchaeota archaeon]|nr:hypothetical protein [Nanoarchaeota archaeon]MBU0977301.1 hypothetical protein [Nanoarchaeota archaeon]